MAHAHQTARRPREAAPSRVQAATRSAAVDPAAAHSFHAGATTCPCGGGCPRCESDACIARQAGDQSEDETGAVDALAGERKPESGEQPHISFVTESGPAPGPDAGPQNETLGGNATKMETNDLSAADWRNNGWFKWWIKWVTDGTSGWIVQKIENTYSGTLADGSAVTNASVGVTPSYYEAWEVDASGGITGSNGGTGNRDRWERPDLGALGSDLHMSMTGTVYWTSQDPAKSGFTSGKVANAGTLLSNTSAPAGIGSALLTRSAYGAWAADGTTMLPGCFTS